VDDVIQGMPENKNAVIGGDMNEHVVNERGGY